MKEVKEYIRIYKGNNLPNRFILLKNTRLPKKHIIALLALGKLYSYAMNLSRTPTITSKEFIKILKYYFRKTINLNTVYYYLHELTQEGYLKRIKRGEYKFNPEKIELFLKELKEVKSC